jgi:hypothetical protein
MKSLLNDLPEVLLSSLLSTWLTLVDVARVDSAVCSTVHRSDFLRSVYQPSTLFREVHLLPWEENHAMGDMINAWIMKKGVSVAKIYATPFFVNNRQLRRTYLQRHGRAIRSLHYMRNLCSSVNYSECTPSAVTVAEYCPNLTEFDAGNCLFEPALLAIAKGCFLLKKLMLCGTGCTQQVIWELSANCKRIQELHLTCRQLDDEACLIALVRANPGLHTFSTCGSGATDNFLREVAQNCPGFTDLSLLLVDVTQASIYFLLQRCGNFSRLCLESGHFQPSEEDQEPVLRPSMRSLVLRGMDLLDDELDCLLRSCPGLTELELSGCRYLTELEELAVAQRCPHLQKLVMYDCMSFAGDVVLQNLSERCPQLRELQIQECKLITDVGLSALTAKCPLLQHLDIRGSSVTDKFLTTIPQHWPALRGLILCDCPNITAAGIEAVTQGCTELEALSVDGCQKIEGTAQCDIGARYPSEQYVCNDMFL